MTEPHPVRANPVRTDQARDEAAALAVRTAYRLGWTLGPRLPDPVLRRLAQVIGSVGVRRGGPAVGQLRTNLHQLTGRPPSPALLRAALASWARTLLEAFALPGWSREQILARVSVRGDGPLRAAVAERGAVVALPHSGNWDLAGAWACLTGMPVSTVAEELTGAVGLEFAEFLRLRERLGMTVYGHRDPAVLHRLVTDARPGRVVCLVADRDLLGSGVSVRFGRRPGAPVARLPAGPALVARRSGAALFPMVARYTRAGIAMHIGDEVPAQPGRDGLIAMTQAVADVFSDRLVRAPEDWHVLVPFFPDEPTVFPDEPIGRTDADAR